MAFTFETKRRQRFAFMRCLYDRTAGSEATLVYIEEVAEEIHLPELETEMIALYLVDEGLIRIRMGHIICITHLGVDEVETALARPDKPTTHFPALQAPPSRPERAPKARADRDKSRERDRDRNRDRDKDVPPPSPPPVNKPGDDLGAIDLRHICEAIGLDPKEFAEAAAPGADIVQSAPAPPVERHDPSNDVSDDVRKLIEQLQVGGAQGFAFHANGGEVPDEPATPPAGRTRTRSLKLAHRESAQIPPSIESDLADLLTSLKLRLLKIRLDPVDMAEAEAEITTAVAQLLSPRPKQQIITLSLSSLLSILEKAGAAALTDDVELSLSKLRAYLSQLSA